MSRNQVKKIVKKYVNKLKENNYHFSSVYLFGSYAKGKPGKWSDIDVAVISDKLRKNYDKNRFLLWKLRREIDTRIEPHGFSPQDFKNTIDPMVHEIKTTGIKIA
ncbi:MAG: nucleotidyltransferase domain-containing protein [Patescibacteria group bacterium]